MSLSSHLRDKKSPVRQWFEEHLPNTRAVAAEANPVLHRDECIQPAPEGSDPGLVGTGVDYLLRASLRDDALENTAAARGVRMLSSIDGVGERSVQLCDEAIEQIRQLDPSGPGQMLDGDWRRCCELMLILARFEQYRRNRVSPAVHEKVLEPLIGYEGQLLGLIPAMQIEEASIEDLAALGRLACEEAADLAGAEPLHLNPLFPLSGALGGADADLIYGTTLLERKSNTPRNIVGRNELWQMVGYALADSDDEYGIETVEISALRWGTSYSWCLVELLDSLAAEGPASVEELRGSFAEVVRGAGGVVLRGNAPPRPGRRR